MASSDIAEIQRVKVFHWTMILSGLVLGLFATIVICLSIGSVSIPFGEVIDVLLGGGTSLERQILLNLRLPRILLAGLVGAALSVAGATMQGLFRNPMASPSIIGISYGAAFGAAMTMVLGISWLTGDMAVPAMAFLFSFVTLFLVYMISRNRNGYVPVETLLLAGIAVGSLFSALVSAMEYFAGEKLSGVVFWLMGGFYQTTWVQVGISFFPIVAGCVVIMFLAHELNVMMVGEEQAGNLGINVNRVRIMLLLASSLLTAIAVSFCGIIGFVGLIIPHVVRIIVGPDHRILIPCSIVGGALFMIWTDMVARTIIAPAELPVGIITSLVGAPFFIYLLMSRKRSMGW